MEGDEGIERPSNTLTNTSSNACCLADVLDVDCPVLSHNCDGATVAHPGIAALAWTPCHGTGTVAQRAGCGN